MLPRILVLLSTYNGEKYLSQQLDSVLSQEDVDVSILIRDDGSSDSTRAILNDYCFKYNNISVMSGSKNLRSGNSFMKLVYFAGQEGVEQYDYYAFADQDDIWLNQKLIRAVRVIGENNNNNEAMLYCSNQVIYKDGLESSLRFTGPPQINIASVINSNKVSGCTFVMNQKLMKGICTASHPSEALMLRRMHDVWIVLAALCIGKIVYDEESYILYRIHENNVVGVKKKTLFEQLKMYWRNLTDTEYGNYRSWTARETLEAFSDVQGRNREILEELSYYRRNKVLKKRLLSDSETLSKVDKSIYLARVKILFNML